MARSYSGFVAQNETVKEQWRAMEATQQEFARYLDLLTLPEREDEVEDGPEDFIAIPE